MISSHGDHTLIVLPCVVSEMLLAVLSICSEEELLETDTNRDMGGRVRADMPAPTPEEIQVIRNKILAVGKMQRLFRMLRLVFLTSHCGIVCG